MCFSILIYCKISSLDCGALVILWISWVIETHIQLSRNKIKNDLFEHLWFITNVYLINRKKNKYCYAHENKWLHCLVTKCYINLCLSLISWLIVFECGHSCYPTLGLCTYIYISHTGNLCSIRSVSVKISIIIMSRKFNARTVIYLWNLINESKQWLIFSLLSLSY